MKYKLLLLILLFVGLNQTSAQDLTSADCLSCHNDPELTKEVSGKEVSIFVDEKTFKSSIHGELECADCHSDVGDAPHEPAPSRVSCKECHSDQQDAYDQGLHAKSHREGREGAASCLSCHGKPHSILPSSDAQSPVSRGNIPKTCGECHGVKFVMEKSGIGPQPFFSYQHSVHGEAVQAGITAAAICTDCHESHDIRSPADPKSPIFKFSVPNTCGQCHKPITAEFVQSIHGQALSRGNWQAPVCTDCHGIHLIKQHIDPTSSVANQAVARTTCAQCHEGVKLSQEFGVLGKRVATYLDSYHGLASKLGSEVVANCASCHGIHNILPSSDPRSMVHKANLSTTCGKCHPGSSENFARGTIHVDLPVTEDFGSIATHWIRIFYLWLIFIVIGGMLLHNAFIWWKKISQHRLTQERTILRLPTPRRIQHLLLLISFAALAFTGFALKYPDSWLALMLGSNESIRRWGHRGAAIVFLIGGIYHFAYVLSTRAGWKFLDKMRPVLKDLFDPMNLFLYYLGRKSAKPRFAEFNYAEKMEYWAFIWGIIIMGVTGLMVWFKVTVTDFLPRWTVDAALAIHFYEAILATLAILVWHFYHVIFDPDVYPMNWAWWDGRVSVEHFQHEHPLAYEQFLKEEEERKKQG